jgi:hypothetical protein
MTPRPRSASEERLPGGKKLTATQAATLTSAAQQIIATIRSS